MSVKWSHEFEVTYVMDFMLATAKKIGPCQAVNVDPDAGAMGASKANKVRLMW